jgi:hypothetical protein
MRWPVLQDEDVSGLQVPMTVDDVSAGDTGIE